MHKPIVFSWLATATFATSLFIIAQLGHRTNRLTNAIAKKLINRFVATALIELVAIK